MNCNVRENTNCRANLSNIHLQTVVGTILNNIHFSSHTSEQQRVQWPEPSKNRFIQLRSDNAQWTSKHYRHKVIGNIGGQPNVFLQGTNNAVFASHCNIPAYQQPMKIKLSQLLSTWRRVVKCARYVKRSMTTQAGT